MASLNEKVTVIATRKVGRFEEGDRITIEKYAARVLVAYGKARFENDEDDCFAARISDPPKRRRVYKRRDMVPES